MKLKRVHAQVIEPGQKPRVLASTSGEQTVPSVVAYTPGEAGILVGAAARK